MSKRFAWLLGAVGLVLIGLLVACGSSYNASSDGLLLVASQGSGLIETFSFNLNNGGAAAVFNTPADTSGQTCVLNGVPSSIVVDPAGAYAYAIINGNSLCNTGTVTSTTGILAFKVNSNGTVTQVGQQVPFNPGPDAPIFPGNMAMDPAGKFLFVADRATTTDPSIQPVLPVSGAVSVFAIGSGGALTEVSGSPFFPTPQTIVPQASLDIITVAPTPTVYPPVGITGSQNAVCSTVGLPPPTSQYLYAVDKLGDQVFEFQVDPNTGVLTNPSTLPQQPSFPTDATPIGVAVDPCNRFVYVSGSLNEKVNAYTMCNGSQTQSPSCTQLPGGSLVPVAGSPFAMSGSPISVGPMVIDPFGNYVYVLGTGSNTINILKIAPVSGALTAASPATVPTGLGPASIAIRNDDNWLFVANFGTGVGGSSVSQYSVTPATGALNALPVIQTDNYPFGVAVK